MSNGKAHLPIATSANRLQCAAAIRWAGFKECIFATPTETLTALGWMQFSLKSEKVFAASQGLGSKTVLLQRVLENETDPYFAWQFDDSKPCPPGCVRDSSKKFCKQGTEEEMKLKDEL